MLSLCLRRGACGQKTVTGVCASRMTERLMRDSLKPQEYLCFRLLLHESRLKTETINFFKTLVSVTYCFFDRICVDTFKKKIKLVAPQQAEQRYYIVFSQFSVVSKLEFPWIQLCVNFYFFVRVLECFDMYMCFLQSPWIRVNGPFSKYLHCKHHLSFFFRSSDSETLSC